MNLNFVPQNKHDLDACKNLNKFTSEDLVPHFEILLPWLQDMNWPVALPISEKLASANAEIVPFINEVLLGDDEIWKCNIIEYLVMKLKPEVMELALIEVVKIINSPSKSEVEEGVKLIAREAVFYYSHCV
ncbi:DUF5071 domain-containing protein [Pseudoalteromonas luteoviolacea]|uniref:DUF5071 domain-containing protein n=2 Tax=Pseudoalteromonas luteoviolacea TaxID=43657 RepID=A0A167DA86_9GAMM|nr:DUF5071 domain-containing protein [Pseudoalteromonas luteoviolacea]KZN48602.1 hypothetical protein N475_06120 [Pseudoalteromonas luteoviolacea DSM 6061]KZN53975.1 hypothetical protein N474_18660 [Pseudoalteromonas luteoviolacea CPMOR-2]MBE0388692.1 hypothetical protein [Pseudoalteromonas luteoviolacea DSM 6061]